MRRRILLLALALLCLALPARGEILWPEAMTAGQQALQRYVAQLNADLSIQGEGAVNSRFEIYPGLAVLGITEADMADTPEGVEMTFTLSEDRVESLQLRVSDSARFPVIAGCCIQAATAEMSAADAMKGPRSYADRVRSDPASSFEETVLEGAGISPRMYYAYYPNQYQDGVSWLQMTLIMPLDPEAPPEVTPVPAPEEYTLQEDDTGDPRYNDYGYGYDDETHLEIFVTPTPEPDPFGEGK